MQSSVVLIGTNPAIRNRDKIDVFRSLSRASARIEDLWQWVCAGPAGFFDQADLSEELLYEH
jgi:hypothetical protein